MRQRLLTIVAVTAAIVVMTSPIVWPTQALSDTASSRTKTTTPTQPSVAWRQVLATLRTGNPGKATLNQFTNMWQRFDQQGLFNVGTPQAKLDQTLGAPDTVLLMDNDLYRQIYGYMAIDLIGRQVVSVTDLRGLEPSVPTVLIDQKISLDLGHDPAWQVNYRCRRAFTSLSEWTLPNEHVQNWTKLVTVQRLHLQGRSSAGTIAKQFVKTLQESGRGVIGKTIESDDQNVTLEWSIPSQNNAEQQHEITRYLTDGDDVIRVAYTVRGATMEPKERSIWLHRLRKASIDELVVNAR